MINRIEKLDKNISNKIAAGEVIDRPSSVIKELVENAVDAGSTSIIVEIKDAGKSFIRISDDGVGINKKDLELAFERHATSKIKSDHEIYNIKSLGFRGEALASIASISDVEIITKTQDDETGIKGEVKNGEMVNKQEIGCPQGTTIIVKDLFYNIPARFKFLKSDSSETNSISNMVNKLALSHPEIAVRYIIDNKIIFATQGKGDIHKTIHTIYGKDISKNLIKISNKENEIAINGYISNISTSRGNRQLQTFFINGRYVKSKVLSEAIDLSYKTLLPSNKFSICFLYIDISYDKVDVNIHPAKTEIRFNDEKLIKGFIGSTIKKYLLNTNLIPKVGIESNHSARIVDTSEQVNKREYINSDKINESAIKLSQDAYEISKYKDVSKDLTEDYQIKMQEKEMSKFDHYIDDYFKNNTKKTSK